MKSHHTKVTQFHCPFSLSVITDEYICCFEITVDDFVVVEELKPRGHSVHDVQAN